MRMRRYEETETWYDRSLTVDPEYVSTLANKVLCFLLWKGYTDEIRELINIFPYEESQHWAWAYAEATYGRDFEEVLRRLESLQVDSFEIVSLYFNKNLAYALIYHMQGKASLKKSYAESARQTLESLIELSPEDPRYHSALGLAYAFLGRKEDAIQRGNKAVNLYPIKKDAYWGMTYILNLSHIYIIVEEYDEAINHLEHLMSVDAGRDVSIKSLQIRPIYDPLRDLPRFKRLLEKYSDQD